MKLTKKEFPFKATGTSTLLFGTREAGNTNKMVRSPAYAWLENFKDDSERDIMEDTRYIEYYDQFITLLWMREDLSD